MIPYEQITLERTHCFGSCPAYRVIFRRNGTARLITNPDSEESREIFEGTVRLRTYARLALMVDSARRSSPWSRYSASWTDDFEARISAGNHEYSWEAVDYGEVAPIEIWSLERVLHGLREETKWERKPAS
jgi:hypothetical protein